MVILIHIQFAFSRINGNLLITALLIKELLLTKKYFKERSALSVPNKCIKLDMVF
jgi:hypothetical protein